MDWGEFRVLYTQKQREALAATQRARAFEGARERQARWRSVGSWLRRLRSAIAESGTSRDHMPRRDPGIRLDSDDRWDGRGVARFRRPR